jgi:transposase
MRRFVEGADRGQSTLFPECLEDWIGGNNPVRVIDVVADELDLAELGFGGVDPEVTGRPSYHPAVLLKLYIYGYLNGVQSNRRLEREAGRNVEVMWLTGRLVPDHKTIADFRKDNGTAIRKMRARFIALCRTIGLLTQASVAIDGSKFKAVNNRDKNFTRAKMERRMARITQCAMSCGRGVLDRRRSLLAVFYFSGARHGPLDQPKGRGGRCLALSTTAQILCSRSCDEGRWLKNLIDGSAPVVRNRSAVDSVWLVFQTYCFSYPRRSAGYRTMEGRC